MPADMRGELLMLQALAVEQLEQIAENLIPPSDQARHLELLEKNSEGVLTSEEQ